MAKKRISKGIVALVIVVLALLTTGAVFLYMKNDEQQRKEADAYENAMTSEDLAVVQNFLDIYTTAPMAHRDSVSLHLEHLKMIEREWEKVLESQSKPAIEAFIKLYPYSNHVTESLLKIDSLDWVTARTDDTPEAYQKYMDTHSNGHYYDDARAGYNVAEQRREAELRDSVTNPTDNSVSTAASE